MSLLCLALWACSSSVSGLVHERDVPEFAALLDATGATPSRVDRIDVSEGKQYSPTDPGDPPQPWPPPERHVAVHRYGADDAPRVYVLIHGMMSDSRAWRFVVGELAKGAGVWVVDLPGCGQSDAPSDDRYEYSPQRMAIDVLRAIEVCVWEDARDRPSLARLPAGDRRPEVPKRTTPPPHITLVGHSLGGRVTLQIAGAPSGSPDAFAHVRSLVDSFILVDALDVSVHLQDPRFRRLALAGDFEIALGRFTGQVRQYTERGTLASVSPPTPALIEEARIRQEYINNDARGRATRAMARNALFWTKDGRPDWARIEAAEARYASIRQPALILWGRRDEILPLSMGYKLAAELPNARIVAMPGVMHSPQLEQPTETIRLIREFVSSLANESGRPALHDAPGKPTP